MSAAASSSLKRVCANLGPTEMAAATWKENGGLWLEGPALGAGHRVLFVPALGSRVDWRRMGGTSDDLRRIRHR